MWLFAREGDSLPKVRGQGFGPCWRRWAKPTRRDANKLPRILSENRFTHDFLTGVKDGGASSHLRRLGHKINLREKSFERRQVGRF